jgi:hypothetical protein
MPVYYNGDKITLDHVRAGRATAVIEVNKHAQLYFLIAINKKTLPLKKLRKHNLETNATLCLQISKSNSQRRILQLKSVAGLILVKRS